MIIIISAVKTIGSFFVRFLMDYISEIIVTAIVFPIKVLEKSTRCYRDLLKPLNI